MGCVHSKEDAVEGAAGGGKRGSSHHRRKSRQGAASSFSSPHSNPQQSQQSPPLVLPLSSADLPMVGATAAPPPPRERIDSWEVQRLIDEDPNGIIFSPVPVLLPPLLSISPSPPLTPNTPIHDDPQPQDPNGWSAYAGGVEEDSSVAVVPQSKQPQSQEPQDPVEQTQPQQEQEQEEAGIVVAEQDETAANTALQSAPSAPPRMPMLSTEDEEENEREGGVGEPSIPAQLQPPPLRPSSSSSSQLKPLLQTQQQTQPTQLQQSQQQQLQLQQQQLQLQQVQHHTRVEAQWRHIYETLIEYVIDPHDVPAVLDLCISQLLSSLFGSCSAELHRLQKRVRDTFTIMNMNQNQQSQTLFGSVDENDAAATSITSSNKTLLAHLLPKPALLVLDNVRTLGHALSCPHIQRRCAAIAHASYQLHDTEQEKLAKMNHHPSNHPTNHHDSASTPSPPPPPPLLPPTQKSIIPKPSFLILPRSSSSSLLLEVDPASSNHDRRPSTTFTDMKITNTTTESDATTVVAIAEEEKNGLRNNFRNNHRNRNNNNSGDQNIDQDSTTATTTTTNTTMTLTALSVLLGLALRGSRRQQLQLLFYLLVDALPAFLADHPAGGLPTFLLEVTHDNNDDEYKSNRKQSPQPQPQPLVLSVASMTHYHYYGNAYLPTGSNSTTKDNNCNATQPTDSNIPIPIPPDNNDNSNNKAQGVFLESKSRPAPRLRVTHLIQVLKAVATATATPAPTPIPDPATAPASQTVDNPSISMSSSSISNTTPVVAADASTEAITTITATKSSGVSSHHSKENGTAAENSKEPLLFPFASSTFLNRKTSTTPPPSASAAPAPAPAPAFPASTVASVPVQVPVPDAPASVAAKAILGEGRTSPLVAERLRASAQICLSGYVEANAALLVLAEQLEHLLKQPQTQQYAQTQHAHLPSSTVSSSSSSSSLSSSSSSTSPSPPSSPLSSSKSASASSTCLSPSPSSSSSPSTITWTLQQFDDWASHALAKEGLVDHFMGQLLGNGVLPSPELEHYLVHEAWRKDGRFFATLYSAHSSSYSSYYHHHHQTSNNHSHSDIDMDSSSALSDPRRPSTVTTVSGSSSSLPSALMWGNLFINTLSSVLETCGTTESVSAATPEKIMDLPGMESTTAENHGVSRHDDDASRSNGSTTIQQQSLSQSSLPQSQSSQQQQQQPLLQPTPVVIAPHAVWGGFGGLDGGGGCGLGVLYCVDKVWWDAWKQYSGWTRFGETLTASSSSRKRRIKRPCALSSERLLERSKGGGDWSSGTFGSYEVMKPDLKCNVDYVLIPPSVWDVLYELYGGGPPLPRMVIPSIIHARDSKNFTVNPREAGNNDTPVHNSASHPPHIPDFLTVATHPWVVHVQLCDPLQPYRRGEAGMLTLRVMATPDQPLWRLLAELLVRFPLHAYRSFVENRGKARLWKRIPLGSGNEQTSRYGPWSMLCMSRDAAIPLISGTSALRDLARDYEEFLDNWKAYTDNATVEECGLRDHDHIMLECATLNKSGDLVWPREAAAKAGRVRRLAEEDMKFRQTLQGVDAKGSVLLNPPELVGMGMDAMDSSGRWYPVSILEVAVVDDQGDEEHEEVNYAGETGEAEKHLSRKKLRVDFKSFGGHEEWIDVESDRLAMLGRFTSDSEKQMNNEECIESAAITLPEANPKPRSVAGIVRKSTVVNEVESGKISLWPGFGACGLTNLGNTCYVNSAIQCISYLPMLRSYLLSSQYKINCDLNRENPLGTGGKLFEEFAELMRAMWSCRYGEKSPIKFRTMLGKVNSQFSGADQQDAQEFLNYILDVLHEDSNKVRNKPFVEALDDEWVVSTALPRVADEAWRRFLRRNRSIMTDVAMGQVLNTVTCPVCQYSSRNFDPFNLLSIPIPTVTDVVFICTVVRRATALNCPWVLNKPRKGDKKPVRFVHRVVSSTLVTPSEANSAEQYVIPMSRLADSGDLRLQIQNHCGIPESNLKLFRVEEMMLQANANGAESKSVVSSHFAISLLMDRDGPCSSLVKKRAPGEAISTPITHIVAFEFTLCPRIIAPLDPNDETNQLEDTADEDEVDGNNTNLPPSPKEQATIKRSLAVYGDGKECRLVDTNPLLIAKAVSRSLWPKSEHEFKLGLRVDARDHRGNWFPGSVVEVIEDDVNGGDIDTGETVNIRSKKVRVHFDNYSSKWDELYNFEHFESGSVRPLYSNAVPRPKATEFLVQNRHTDRATGKTVIFGQTFYLQFMNDWTNARAGAHILAQASRYLRHDSNMWKLGAPDDPQTAECERMAQRLYEKTQTTISDLIDLLIDCDRQYVLLALGMSDLNQETEKQQPFRNSSFDPTPLLGLVLKKVGTITARLPFEVKVYSTDGITDTSGSPTPVNPSADEMSFPWSLMRTIGNYLNARHAIVLHWKEPPIDKKTGAVKYVLHSPVMFVMPPVEVDKAGSELLRKSHVVTKSHSSSPSSSKDTLSSTTATAVASPGRLRGVGNMGIDLGVCLTEFCKAQKLSISDNWKCPHCQKYREGQQSMNLWRLPDLLTFHVKRFNMSARWREKITTKVNFPLTGLDMNEWCHKGDESSPSFSVTGDNNVYDLIGVMNHFGSMTGGHYVAVCKATPCSRDGREDVAYSFDGVGAHDPLSSFFVKAAAAATTSPGFLHTADELLSLSSSSLSCPLPPPPPPTTSVSSGWRALGRFPSKLSNESSSVASATASHPSHWFNTPAKISAALCAQSASESAEPLWLQFDDEVVEPIPPRSVVTEGAYVLFYRRRQITASNITKYSTVSGF